ncbi:TPA: glycosyltransferase family 4 protein [Raoultella planticola]
MEKKCIVQICRDASDTGGGRVVIETSKYFAMNGYQVIIITDTECDLRIDGISFKYTWMGQRLKHWNVKNKLLKTVRHFLQMSIFMFLSSYELRKIKKCDKIVLNHNLESISGDIYVLHNVFNYENLKKNWLRKVLRWFNPVFLLRGGRELFLLSRAKNKTVICVSEKTLSEAKVFCNHNSNLLYINNGVNSDFFSYKVRDSLYSKCDMIFVGHEFERKGLDYAIESLLFVPDYVNLYIVGGSGSSQTKYENLALKYNVSHRVHFKGTVLGKELVSLYHECDLFILPSTYETWALVGLESMSCGLPVLMTKVGGIPEYLSDHINGFFITQDSQDIANKINFFVENPEKYCKFSENARMTSLKHSWAVCAEKYLDVINSI